MEAAAALEEAGPTLPARLATVRVYAPKAEDAAEPRAGVFSLLTVQRDLINSLLPHPKAAAFIDTAIWLLGSRECR